MAYMNQEKKAKLAPAIKAICKQYKVKASLSVRNHTELVLTIKSGPVDFFGNYTGVAKGNINVNDHHYQSVYTGEALEFLTEIIPAMNVGNHNNSDTMSDYFDVGFYISINVGTWDKPYQLA